MEEEKPEINLKHYKRHSRKLPYQFIIKVVIGITAIVLMFYLAKILIETEKSEEEEGIKLELGN